jgi:hypothetical protein
MIMDELRDKITKIIRKMVPSEKRAEAILDIPEIREALAYRNAVLASRLPDLPPDRVGEIIRNLANRTA